MSLPALVLASGSALRPHNPCPTRPSSRPAQINARRINDELNVFKDIHRSPIFIGVLIVTAGLQVRDARRVLPP